MSNLASGNGTYVAALIVLAGLGLVGLLAALLIPSEVEQPAVTRPG